MTFASRTSALPTIGEGWRGGCRCAERLKRRLRTDNSGPPARRPGPETQCPRLARRIRWRRRIAGGFVSKRLDYRSGAHRIVSSVGTRGFLGEEKVRW